MAKNQIALRTEYSAYLTCFVVMVNRNQSARLILYCGGYFYLTNSAAKILAGEDTLIVVGGQPIPGLHVPDDVEIWVRCAVRFLLLAPARLAGIALANEGTARPLHAACAARLYVHGQSPCG